MKVMAEIVNTVGGADNQYDVYIGNVLIVGGTYITNPTPIEGEKKQKGNSTPQDIKNVIKLKNRGFSTEEIIMLTNGGVI